MLDMPTRISEWLLLLVNSQRSVAYLLIDNELTLIEAGGELEYYGLADLKGQHSASDQLPFLEGLWPLDETPFLLQSVGMPSGRVADVHFFAEEERTWVLFLDVTAEHDDARKIQQKAYDMTLLSQREARPPSPRGAMQITAQLPARNATDFCRPRSVSSSELSPISAKSITSV